MSIVNDADFAARLKALKQDRESRAAPLRAKLSQSHRLTERYQKKLDELNARSEAEIRNLTREYLALPAPAVEAAPARSRRTRRWSLDEPVLKLIHSMQSPVIAVPDVWLQWNREHLETEVGRTTIRGILERLRRDGELEVVDDGKPGRKKVRLYKLASVSVEPQEEGVTAH
jgi:sugar-specific transcriptional regulator TrmB